MNLKQEKKFLIRLKHIVKTMQNIKIKEKNKEKTVRLITFLQTVLKNG